MKQSIKKIDLVKFLARIWGDMAVFQKFIFFKGCISQILLNPFFNTLSQMRLLFTEKRWKLKQDKKNQMKTTPSCEVYHVYIEE